MSRPDLNTPEGLDAYRQELRGVAKPLRIVAFALILIGFAAVIGAVWVQAWPHWLINAGYIALGVGWIAMIAAVFIRSRHHRRRMAESE